jgi:hypothetical protein
MTDKPDLSKPETILSFPIFQLGQVALVSDDNCEIFYRERTIKTSQPRQTVVFKYMPKTLAHYMSETDLMLVCDSEGRAWAPVLTEAGWMRRRVYQ